MLKSYVCVACEKVIFAKDNVASLIGLFSKIILTLPPETEIPPNAVAPKEWAIFSSWDVESGDEKKEYFHCVQVLYRDHSQFGEIAKTKINIEANSRAQVATQLIGFPIGQLGEYKIRVWIEESQKRVMESIEFGIEVSRRERGVV